LADLSRRRPGGGRGFGAPLEREPEKVLNDVIDGYIDVEHAKNDYGVVIDTATMKVSEQETAKLRQVLAQS
jgi:N-methylhydantoinase B